MVSIRYLVFVGLVCAAFVGCDKKAKDSSSTSKAAVTATGKAKAGGDKCKDSENCKKYGDCTLKKGKCAVVSDADCKNAKVCKDEGRCKALNGMCTKP